MTVDPPSPTTRDRVRLTIVGTQHPECPLVFEGGAKDPAGSNIGFSTTFPECGSPLPAEEGFRRTFEIEDPLDLPGTYVVHVTVKNDPQSNVFEVFDVLPPSPELVLGDAMPAAAQELSIALEPLRPTTLEPVHVTVRMLLPLGIDPRLRFSHVEGEKIVFSVGSLAGPNLPPPSETWTAEATVGPLKKGFYTVVVDSETDFDFQRTFEVIEPSAILSLREKEGTFFSVSVDFEPPPGSNLRGTGYGVPLTRESGYFWFFEPDNVEVTVKILDGRPVNGRYWIFLASMTDLRFTARVTQCPASPLAGIPCVTKEYRSEPGVNRNIVDVDFQGLPLRGGEGQ